MTEPRLLELRVWDRVFGRLAFRDQDQTFALEIAPAFAAEGHDLSPLNFPASSFTSSPRLIRTGDSPFAGGLPGLIADSLPDSWGERMLRQELPGLKSTIGKLAAIGNRGFGAFTYAPVLGGGADGEGEVVNLASVAREAAEIVAHPLTGKSIDDRLKRALSAGSSLGGAQPKISAHLPLKQEIMRVGEVLVGGPTPEGYTPCILKLTHLPEESTGAVEFAFSTMAKKSGIRIPDTALVFDGQVGHFACARFDRVPSANGGFSRKHCHTLSGILHRRASDGAIDYEDFMRLTKNLTRSIKETEECFRRAVFNLLALNRDDHGRNHAFIYDEVSREWALAPAYDLTPSIANVLIGLSWMGRSEIPTHFEQVTALAEVGGISKRRAKEIFDQVAEATIGGWRAAARAASVASSVTDFWEQQMLTQTRELRTNLSS